MVLAAIYRTGITRSVTDDAYRKLGNPSTRAWHEGETGFEPLESERLALGSLPVEQECQGVALLRVYELVVTDEKQCARMRLVRR